MKAKRSWEPKTDLQKLFLKRIQEELDARGLSRNALCSRVGGPPQTTFNDVMRGADPRLETIHQIATALGMPAWKLLIEKSDIAAAPVAENVTSFPGYPSMVGHADKPVHRKKDDRKKRRA